MFGFSKTRSATQRTRCTDVQRWHMANVWLSTVAAGNPPGQGILEHPSHQPDVKPLCSAPPSKPPPTHLKGPIQHIRARGAELQPRQRDQVYHAAVWQLAVYYHRITLSVAVCASKPPPSTPLSPLKGPIQCIHAPGKEPVHQAAAVSLCWCQDFSSRMKISRPKPTSKVPSSAALSCSTGESPGPSCCCRLSSSGAKI